MFLPVEVTDDRPGFSHPVVSVGEYFIQDLGDGIVRVVWFHDLRNPLLWVREFDSVGHVGIPSQIKRRRLIMITNTKKRSSSIFIPPPG